MNRTNPQAAPSRRSHCRARRRASGAGLLLFLSLLLLAGSARAIITLPASADLWHQTGGQERCGNIGDWYTSNPTSGCPAANTPSGNPLEHRIEIDVPPSALSGGSAVVRIIDAESVAGGTAPDEIQGGQPDPVRFWLQDEFGATIGDVVLEGGANDQQISFTVTSAGRYTLRTVTGSVPIPMDSRTATALNDDDNAWKLELPTGARVLFFESSLAPAGGVGDVDFYFTVGPGVTGLQLRNFDVDGGFSSLTYRRPSGATVSGTQSGNARWNGPGATVDTGADQITGLATGPGGADLGVWTIEVRGWSGNNQAVFEVLDQNGDALPPADDADTGGVTNSGSWSMVADTTLTSTTNVAVDHPFTVTNDFTVDDVVNFDLAGTLAGFTTELRVDGGGPLADTDGDGRPDTGLLASGASLDLVLRVTGTVAGTDVTTVTGTSSVAAALGVAPASIAVDKTTDVSEALSVTKTVVDLGGGEADLDDELEYTITLTNNTAAPLTDLDLTDTVPALLTALDLDPLPAGTDASDLPNNLIAVNDITVAASSSLQFVFRGTIAGAEPGDTIDNSVSVTDGGAISVTADAPTITVSPSAVANEGTKQLYMDITDTPGNDAPVDIARALPTIANSADTRVELDGGGGSATWPLSPVLAGELSFAADISVVLYLKRQGGGGSPRDVRVEVLRNGTPVLTQLASSLSLSNSNNNPSQVIFDAFTSTAGDPVVFAAGDALALRVTNETNGNRRVRVYARRGQNQGDTEFERRSRLILDATTIIEIDELAGYTDAFTATGGSAGGVFTPGETVFARATVSDPFGADDITGAALTVTDPNGTGVFSDPMTEVGSTSGTKTFEVPVVLGAGAPVGNWTLEATATEGVPGEENTDLTVSTFEVGLPDFLILKSSSQVFSDPVNGTSNPKRIPGAVVLYQIQVSNQGRGRADADSVDVADTLPGGLELGVRPGGADPITFSDGGTASGLTFDFATDVVFDLSSGTEPEDLDGDGCYDNVDGFVVTPTGRMNGEAPPAPSFTLGYRACVQ